MQSAHPALKDTVFLEGKYTYWRAYDGGFLSFIRTFARTSTTFDTNLLVSTQSVLKSDRDFRVPEHGSMGAWDEGERGMDRQVQPTSSRSISAAHMGWEILGTINFPLNQLFAHTVVRVSREEQIAHMVTTLDLDVLVIPWFEARHIHIAFEARHDGWGDGVQIVEVEA